jgi:hypothetical protein
MGQGKGDSLSLYTGTGRGEVCVFIPAGPIVITKLFAWGEGCVFITAVPITKLFAGGGGGYWRTCAMRDDEPRPV